LTDGREIDSKLDAGEIGFEINTTDFAGPMDLLVYLVRRRELDVAFISVSAITLDYLEWLEKIELMDLDAAADFILLASILLQFKAHNMLPSTDPELSDVELQASDRELSQAELAALRETAMQFAELEAQQIHLFDRGNVELTGLDQEITASMLSDVSVFDLALAFRDLIYKLPVENLHVVEKIPFTLEGQMAFVISVVSGEKRTAFTKLASLLSSRLAVIMTFLALLELIRLGKVRVAQEAPFEPLWLIQSGKDK
jgi:segregation and condensation protein A